MYSSVVHLNGIPGILGIPVQNYRDMISSVFVIHDHRSS